MAARAHHGHGHGKSTASQRSSVPQRKIALPWPLLLGLLLALGALAAQGLRMAADRSARLQPAPVAAEIRLVCEQARPAAPLEVERVATHAVLLIRRDCAPPEARLALMQELGERDLLRWLEPGAGAEALALPLEGLSAGIYRIVTAPDSGNSAPREMDAPVQEWPVRARFVLRDP